MAGWWLQPQWLGSWLLRLPGTLEYLSPYHLYLDAQFDFLIFIGTLSFVHVAILTEDAKKNRISRVLQLSQFLKDLDTCRFCILRTKMAQSDVSPHK